MSVTITDLQLQVNYNANKATKGIDALVGSLKQLKATLQDTGLDVLTTNILNFTKALDKMNTKGFGKAMKAIKDSAKETVSEVKEATDEITTALGKVGEGSSTPNDSFTPKKIKEVGESAKKASAQLKGFTFNLKKASKATKHHASMLSKLARSFARIMFYRGIRTLLSNISNAFREGAKNVALYSKALNGLDSNNANGVMSELATTGLYLKNSFGAAVIPILKALVPMFNALADAVINVVNAFNMFFNALAGRVTFTKAKKYAVDYAESLDKAGGSAKKLKDNLLGIDELNIINDDNGSGGGGSGSDMDYSQMFEEGMVNLPSWLENLKDLILNGDYEGLGAAIAELLAKALKSIDWNTVRTKAHEFGENISKFIKGFFDPNQGLLEEVGKAVAQTINTVAEFIGGLVEDKQMWTNIGTSLARGIDSFVNTIDVKLLADTISNVFIGVFEAVRALLAEGNASDTFYKIGEKIGELIKGLNWTEILKGLGQVIWEAIKAAVSLWNGIFDAFPMATTIATGFGISMMSAKIVNSIAAVFTKLLNTVGITVAIENGAVSLGTTFGFKFAAAAAVAIGGYKAGNWLYEEFMAGTPLDINYWGDQKRANDNKSAQEWASAEVKKAETAWYGAIGSAAFELDWSQLITIKGDDVWADKTIKMSQDLGQLGEQLKLTNTAFTDTTAVQKYLDKIDLTDTYTKGYIALLSEQYDSLSLNTKAMLEAEYGIQLIAEGYDAADIAIARATVQTEGFKNGLFETLVASNSTKEAIDTFGTGLDGYYNKVFDVNGITEKFDNAINNTNGSLGDNAKALGDNNSEYLDFIDALDNSSLSMYEFSGYMQTLSDTDLPGVTENITNFSDTITDLTTSIPDFDDASKTAFGNIITNLDDVMVTLMML